jgi:hypothetical protein
MQFYLASLVVVLLPVILAAPPPKTPADPNIEQGFIDDLLAILRRGGERRV